MTGSVRYTALLWLLASTTIRAAAAPAIHYVADPSKSSLEFQFTQAGALNKGRFGKFPVTFDFSTDTAAADKLDVVVDMASLDTGDKERDDTLRSADLFAVANYPQARFTSTQVTKTATGYDALGRLTIRGVARDQHLTFKFRTTNEAGRSVGYLNGKVVIKRLEFGVGQGDWKSTEWVGDEVTVVYSVRLLPATP